MAMIVKHNAGAQRSLGELNKNTNKAAKALAKVSSGMKINSAQDDAANFSISERMRVQIRALAQDNQNVQNGSSMVRTAERGIDQIIQNLRTLKERAINAANDSNTDEDRATIQKEFDQIVSTIDDIAIGTQYNGKILLDGRYSNGQKVTTFENTSGSNKIDAPPNTPPLPDGYPFFKSVSSPSETYYKEITNLDNTPITQSGVYTIDSNFSGTITVNTTEAVKFVSSNPTQFLNNVQITGPSGGNANIWIENLKIKNDAGTSVFKFQGSDNFLSVVGDNFFNFSTASNAAVINVGGGLNVQSTSGGSITLTNPGESNGAGIGSDAGENSTADILISGVNINATVYNGAVIGSGRGGSIGNITIDESTMNLKGNWNANIGSGAHGASAGNIIIVHSNITSNNVDTGIGSGYPGSTCGDIGIYNSTLDITNIHSACIGSGEGATCGDILVSNSDITGNSTHGACIGTGSSSATVGDITVINGTKVKHTSPDGAAIGSGLNGKVMGKIQYSDDIEVDASNCYVHPLDADHPGIGRGRNGTATVDASIEPTNNSPEYIPIVNMVNSNPLWIQHGTQANQRINVGINSMQAKDLKGDIPNEADKSQIAALSNSPEKQAELREILNTAKEMTLEDARVTTIDNAKVAIRIVEGALEYALDQATNMGAYLQRFEYTDSNITTMGENVQNSESVIRDADMAKEMAEYTKYNILTQASQAMLAQANQNSSAVLSLLQ